LAQEHHVHACRHGPFLQAMPSYTRVVVGWRRHISLATHFFVTCSGLYDPVNHIESARIYGNIDSYAYYYADLLVGSPPQRVSVIMDTGSGVIGFPCASCGHCGQHIDPSFDFAKSSTASWVPCGSGCTGRCQKNHCSYHQGYTEGSSISGYWFSDYVRIGDSLQKNPAIMGKMGCHQNENNLFYTQKANGIFGIGPGARTLLHTMFGDREHINKEVFAMCLAEWGGRIVLGGHNKSYHTADIKWAPMTVNTGYYGVALSSMAVDGKSVATRYGRTIIDSGTTYVYMATQPYRALKTAIEGYCKKHSSCNARQRGTCWTLSGSGKPSELSGFPSITVSFGSVATNWHPKGYMYRKGTTAQWCYAFEDDGAGAGTVLGAAWMVHHEVIFDMVNNKIGVADANCPEFKTRPTHNQNADMTLPTAGPARTTTEAPAPSLPPVPPPVSPSPRAPSAPITPPLAPALPMTVPMTPLPQAPSPATPTLSKPTLAPALPAPKGGHTHAPKVNTRAAPVTPPVNGGTPLTTVPTTSLPQAALTPSSPPLAPVVPAPKGCTDTPVGWVDRDGDSCDSYAQSGWCTLSGSTGAQWEAGWGPITDYGSGGHTALDTCCFCGGGARPRDSHIHSEHPWETDHIDPKSPLRVFEIALVLLAGTCAAVGVWKLAPCRAHSGMQGIEEDPGGSMPPQIVGAEGEAGPEIFHIGDEDEGLALVHDVEVGQHGGSPLAGSPDAESSRAVSLEGQTPSGHPPVFGGGALE